MPVRKIVIIGAGGMLGTSMMDACRASKIEATGFDLPEMDITRGAGEIESLLPACDCVVNCAAYTRVDQAEIETASAFAVNRDGAANVARACAALGRPLLHVSTDYIFGGSLHRALREDDPPSPLNIYGSSKLAGEEAVRAAGPEHLVVRTQSLFGLRGANFVATILERLRAGRPLRVVADQTMSPTYTRHLASAILALLDCGRRGTVHVAASGSCTWHEFALAIAADAGLPGRIDPISTAEYKAPARRPAYSVLDTARYTEWTGLRMPPWRRGLTEYLGEAAS